MSRLLVAVAAVGVLAAVGWVVLAVFGASVMPSYLAAWLLGIGVPMGALPLVMVLEALGDGRAALLPVLRRLLLLLPAGAVLVLPVLVASGGLFGQHAGHGIPGWWVAPVFLVFRAVVILLVLSGLALLFSRAPQRKRPGVAGLGLLTYAAAASVAAVDWVLAPQPGLGSSVIGMLLMVAQAGLAASLAAFVLAVRTPARARVHGGVPALLAVLLAAWAFVHFVQFLAVWSGNLPEEAAWYIPRVAGLGGFSVAFGAVCVVLGCAVLPTVLGQVPAVLATLAAMAVLAHGVEAFWLVTPAFRAGFVATAADALAGFGIGGLLLALLLLLLPTEVRRVPA